MFLSGLHWVEGAQSRGSHGLLDPLDLHWLANATNAHGDISLVDNYFLAIDFLRVSHIQLSGQLMTLKTQNGHIFRR